MREIVSLDMAAAKAAFSQYLDGANLDSRQIYFVNQIVEYIVHKKFEEGFYKPGTVPVQTAPVEAEPTISVSALLELLKDADPSVKAQLRLALLT